MTFASKYKYLLILNTPEFSKRKYCQLLIIMRFSMSILIRVVSIQGTQTLTMFDDFTLCLWFYFGHFLRISVFLSEYSSKIQNMMSKT